MNVNALGTDVDLGGFVTNMVLGKVLQDALDRPPDDEEAEPGGLGEGARKELCKFIGGVMARGVIGFGE